MKILGVVTFIGKNYYNEHLLKYNSFDGFFCVCVSGKLSSKTRLVFNELKQKLEVKEFIQE